MAIIALANLKGGVGKSTLAVNIAGALAPKSALLDAVNIAGALAPKSALLDADHAHARTGGRCGVLAHDTAGVA